MKNSIKILMGLALLAIGSQAQALVLTSSTQCSAGNATSIAIDDVTGDAGGASDCWGTIIGNDPGPSGDGFDIDGTIFDYVAKLDIDNGLDGADIGLVVAPDSLDGTIGTWLFDQTKFAPSEFLIVLKAANKYGVWLFTGADAASFSGDWFVAWGNNLSHLAIYATDGATVPEPGMVGLLAIGLIGVAVARRKMKV